MIFGLNEQKMFSLLHEYLITDLNTEKRQKVLLKKYKLYFGKSIRLGHAFICYL